MLRYKNSRYTFLVLMFFLLSCTAKIEKRKNVICMVDYSGTISDETLKNYATIISKDVFSNMGEFDKFILTPIDEGTKIEDVILAYHDFQTTKFDRRGDGVTHKRDSINKRLSAFITPLIDSLYKEILSNKDVRKKFTRYTDLINAFEQLPSKLEKISNRSSWGKLWDEIVGNKRIKNENVVVLCSDMIHDSNEFSFNNLKRQDAESIFSKLKSAGRIPSLKGLKVLITGRTGDNNTLIDNIRYFWKKYFDEAGAEIIAYEFDGHYQIADYFKSTRN